MRYSKAQYAMMEQLSGGIVWEWFQDQQADDILRFLDREGLATARDDVQCGLWTLTQSGQAELDVFYQERERHAEERAQKIEFEARDTKKTNQQQRHNLKVAVISAGITGLLGGLFEHFDVIVRFVLSLFHG